MHLYGYDPCMNILSVARMNLVEKQEKVIPPHFDLFPETGAGKPRPGVLQTPKLNQKHGAPSGLQQSLICSGNIRIPHSSNSKTMPSLQDNSMIRLHPRVAGALAVSLWLLGTAQCFLAPPLAPRLNGITGASRITSSRSRLSSSARVRQSSRGGHSMPACHLLLTISPGNWVAHALGAHFVSLLSIVQKQQNVHVYNRRRW